MKNVSIKNIKKVFFTLRRGKVKALQGINLEIEAGSFFVLLGPSGCGKSTLLNITAGIEKPSEGEIFFGSEPVVSVPAKKFLSPKQRDVAMVFQSYALYPHLNVFENIAFPLKIAKEEKGTISNKVKRAASILQIEKLLDAKPGELSGGQRQRVALGRAIVRDPNVLLLDEPLSNLDALLRITMRSELKQLQRELNTTTIYVTHDQTEAMSLGDKIAVLKDGLVLQTGTPHEIYHDPQNLFVAKFIGSPPMNLIEASVLKSFKNKISITSDPAETILGLRPEHLIISKEGEGYFKTKIKMIGSLGSESIIYSEIGSKELLIRISGETGLREGETIYVTFDEQNLFLFNKSDGKRINP